MIVLEKEKIDEQTWNFYNRECDLVQNVPAFIQLSESFSLK